MRTRKWLVLVVALVLAAPAVAAAQERTDEQVRRDAAALPERLWEPGPAPVTSAGPGLPSDGTGVAPLLVVLLVLAAAGAGYAVTLLRPAGAGEAAAPVPLPVAVSGKAPRETCAIALWQGVGCGQFEVRLHAATGASRMVATSLPFSLPPGSDPEEAGPAGSAHRSLLLHLVAAGWQLEPPGDGPWYERRLSRAADEPGWEVDGALIEIEPQRGEAEIVEPPSERAVPERGGAMAGRKTRVLVDFGLLAVAASAAIAIVASVEPVRPFLILAAALLVPGGALLTRLPVDNATTAVALAIGLSLTIDMAASLALVWTRWWHPEILAMVIGFASAALLLDDLRRAVLDRSSGLTRDRGVIASVARSRYAASGATPRPAAPPHRRGLTFAAALAPGLLAVVAWTLSLPMIEVDSLGDYGLPPELPPPWYMALAALLFGAVTATCLRRPSGWVIAGYVGAVTLVLYATVPAVSEVPPYPWTYKHIGVTRLIELSGQVDPSIDIYNRWPGFFALTAVFSGLAGLPNPVSYAAWSEPLFALVDALLVAAIARAVVPDVRVAGYAALVFTVGNWVGGQYFSPQAVAFALVLALMLVAIRTLPAMALAAPRAMRLVERLARQSPDVIAHRLPWRRRAGVATVLCIDAVLVATHQLTPYILVLQVGALVVLAGVRPRWIVLVMAALAVGYLLPHFDYVQRTYGVLSSANPFANAARPTEVFGLDPVAGKRFNARASVLLTLVLWAISLLAALRLALAGYAHKALPLAAVTFAPLAVLLAQSYGGEAALRVILFSLPWCATLVAWAISTLQPRELRIASAFVTAVVLTALFIPAFYGAEQLYVLSSGEVRAAERFSARAPADSVLVSVATGFPGSIGPRYPLLGGRRGDATPDLINEGDRFRHRPLGTGDIPALIAAMRAHSRKSYLVFSTSQARYVATFQLMPPRAFESLERAVAASPAFRPWYVTKDARIYELMGNGR